MKEVEELIKDLCKDPETENNPIMVYAIARMVESVRGISTEEADGLIKRLCANPKTKENPTMVLAMAELAISARYAHYGV